MSITVAEKTHWKERIAQKIERAIKELVAKHDPLYLENAAQRAHQAAIDTLGGTELSIKLSALQSDNQKIEHSIESIKNQLNTLALNKPLLPYKHYSETTWERAVTFQEEAELNRLLSQEPFGQRILKLRSEQESLLDTVWLSTSTVQIRELWKNVTELLSDELSELQQKVLAAGPDKEDAQ